MAFIVKQKIHGKDYYYLRKSFRKGDKVISKHIAYLGKTKKEAEKKAKKILKKMEGKNIENKEKNRIEIKKISIDDMAKFCKRKGFVYPSAEIYGGFSGFWDFGHLGTELKNNIKKEWWDFFVRQREDIVGIDGAVITNPKVWEASGHVKNFIDVSVVCKKCGNKTKIDKFEIGKVKCEKCGGDFEVKEEFNPMFTTRVGPTKENSITSYLRPETAQLIFTNFKFVQENARMKLPFGIAQIGKAFRNEIAPRDFLFRTREFEQMEIEYFIEPGSKCPYKLSTENKKILVYSDKMQEKGEEPIRMSFKEAYEKKIIKTDWHAYWLEQNFLWFINLGANPEKFRIRQHISEEKSHYALDTWDLEYNFPFGWKELQGMANRTDFDLRQHQKNSGVKLEVTNDKGEKFLPHVVCEPSQGIERAMLVFLFDSYFYDEKRDNIILRLNPKLSPIKVAVFPIVKRKDMEKIATEIYNDLKKEFNVLYDKSGSIGRRYSRQDEIGTPFCVTVDEDSLKNKNVTIRERDTGEQVKVKIKNLKNVLSKSVKDESILTLGKKINTRKQN